MSGRRGSSSAYPPRHSPYGGGGDNRYGGRQYSDHNSHYGGQRDDSRGPHQQDSRYPAKSMPPPQQQPRQQPPKSSPQQQQQQQQQSPRQVQQSPQQQSPRQAQQSPQQQSAAQLNHQQQPQKTPPQQQKPVMPAQQGKKDGVANSQPAPAAVKPEPPSPKQDPKGPQAAANASGPQATPNAVNANSTNSKPAGEHAENCKLFVSNVPNIMNDESFRKMFEEHGEVRDIFLNKTKWFGFVLFKTHEQAEKAMRALNGTEKHGRRLNVRYATQQKPDQGGPQGGPGGPQQQQQQQMQQQMHPQQMQGGFGGPQGQGPMPPPQPVKRSGARCRLFVGNLGTNMTDEEFRTMFGAFGELVEVFLHAQKGFGFIKYEQRQQAEAAKAALDNTPHDGRYLQVRFATQGSSLKVKNLSPFVSNELLEDAFSIFGEIDRAVVIVDDRGRSVGEGIVEFARKTSAMAALKKATQGCLLLTASPRPVLVEPLDLRDEEDGFPEKNINKNNPQFLKERELGPRFAEPGTFEYEFSSRWKKLLELEKQKREFLDREMEDERRKLEEEMEYYRYEHETRLLREQLRIMEEQSKIFQHEREMRHAEQKRREEMRRQEEMLLRQREEDILGFPRREQQAQQVASMQQLGAPQQHDPMGAAAAQAKAPTAIEGATFVSSYDSGARVSRFDQQQPPQQHYGLPPDDGRRPAADEYGDRDPKRRRY